MGNAAVSRSQTNQAASVAATHEAAYAITLVPADRATAQPASMKAIHATGWPAQKMYRVWRMIFRPRVPPR